MAQVYTSPGAESDLHEYWAYICKKSGSEEIANRWIDGIYRATEHFAAHPEMGELRRDLNLNVRSFSVGAFVVFFRSRSDGIEIVQVIRGARDIERHIRPVDDE